MHTRPSKRTSSLPMRRKDKERAKLERIVVRNKQNGLTNVSNTNFVNSLQQEILYLEEKIRIQKQNLTVMESQLNEKYQKVKSIDNKNSLKQDMEKEQIAKNNVLESVKKDLLKSPKQIVENDTLLKNTLTENVIVESEVAEEAVVKDLVVKDLVTEEAVAEEEVAEEAVSEEAVN